MDKNKKQIAGMQEMSPDDLGKVTGGETRRSVKKQICPICGEEITVPLATHMRGHPVVPCPVCGNMMPSGRNSKCYNCGYVSSEAGSELHAGGKDTVKSINSTIFLDSKC